MSEKSKLLDHQDSDEQKYGSIKYEKAEEHYPRTYFTRRDCIIVTVVLLIAIIAITITLSLGLPKIREKKLKYLDTSFPVSFSILGTFEKAVVLVDAQPCASIGNDILQKGGSAVDGAIAVLFCDGVVNPHSMGLGGGLFMTVYIRLVLAQITYKKTEVIDGRETAPGNATIGMFEGNNTLSTVGGLAVAVPGELKAYWLAHQRYGKLNWSDLVLPSVKLSRNGIKVGKHLGKMIMRFKDTIMSEPSLREVFFNNATGDVYKEGEILKRPMLAVTLQKIAKNGADELYSGETGRNLIEDIQGFGGIITMEDLKNYEAKVKDAIPIQLRDGETLYTVPPPGCGTLVGFILNILAGFNITYNDVKDVKSSVLTYHRMVEAFKYAYAERTYLGDEDFVNVTKVLSDITSVKYAENIRKKISDVETFPPESYGGDFYGVEDHGTAQVTVVDSEGNAVSASSTINTHFGCKRRSPSTGIILNNEMDDFSSPNVINYFGLPPSPANFIKPGKRPLSSMSPSVILDKARGLKTVIGGSGGSRIITAITQVLIRSMWLGNSIKEAIDALRIHHQLYPNTVFYEKHFPQIYLDGLTRLGHKTALDSKATQIQQIVKQSDGKLSANVDYRKDGSMIGF
ncbi:scoloptoxin SSD14-like [Tachypleus tridentatus]|uniref:scoloptoxin SSD14-like n=1 Tax=Tachypleus tridentatus TaxID=6853 RepID=UPI003FD3FA3C